MGTNIYLAAPHLDEFKDEGDDPGMHIGKSSAGWTFSWRAHEELGLTSRDAWESFMREQDDAAIINEYEALLTFADFRQLAYIENRDPDRVLLGHAQKYGDSLGLKNSVDEHGESFSHYPFF